jgi:galactokinase
VLDVFVESSVPIGAGLSSSAALEVALLRALRALQGVAIDDVSLALMAHRAELTYAGVRCGVMDPMAVSLANGRDMLLLDCRSLDHRLLPLPADSEVAVLDSGVPRSLARTGYNARRGECEQAARLLGAQALRDVADPAEVESLPEPLRRRARHVITENRRVQRAAAGVGAGEFGELMNASHESLRVDFEVSVPALDRLVVLLQGHPSVHGARLTGAGFGGACVALCRGGTARGAGEESLREYNRGEERGRLLVPP